MNDKIPPILKDHAIASCKHGVPFDSECGKCMENAEIYKASMERVNAYQVNMENDKLIPEVAIRTFNHPLKNPNSRYYELWHDVESIDIIESILTKDELIGACKFNILKYQLRLGKKDDTAKECAKIKTYQDYLSYLESDNVEA